MRKFLGLLSTVALVALLSGALAQSTFFGAWPYQLPPDGHFNTFARGRMDMNIYHDLMAPPLAAFIWSQAEYEGIAAESFGFDDDNNYVVTLRDGFTWSDGTPITSTDVVATFNAGYLVGWSVWNSLASVEAVDELTTKFVLSEPSFAVEREILVENLRPASVYGEFAERGAALAAAGATSGDAEFDAALEDLTSFRPEEFVSGGPYIMLEENISAANVRLVKNEGGVNADVVRFDEVVLWNGETEVVTPLVAGQDLWYATHGFPPATEASFVDQGIDIIRAPMYSGPALYFNHSVAPFDNPVVRRAIAHVIDRETNGFVSLGESGVAVEFMAGFSDSLVPNYLSDEAIDSLNTYDFDPDAAAAMLEEIGWSRGNDGVWLDADGDRMAFELIFPAEFADWAAAAENATQALNDFGFDITARGVQFQQQQQEVYDSNFELAIRNFGTGSPFAYQSFLEPYRRYNGQGEVAGEQAAGMRFDANVSYSGGDLNVLDATVASSQGLDTEAQNALVEQLVMSFNELLPIIPLWERYTNNPINRSFVDAPEGSDPIYTNAGVDHFMPYLILTGQIGPSN